MSDSTSHHRARLIVFGLVIFLSSACLLVLEIVASRLLAPYIGVSLYTWTAIIGVILAGLSVGNWLGGFWADRGGGTAAAGGTLILSAITTLVIPYLLIHVADAIQAQRISLMNASLIYVLALFLVPAFLLGIVTPLLTTVALGYSQRPGSVVGTMHALAALGSICGTFAAGFWLIPWLGTRPIILLTGAVLAVMGLAFITTYRKSSTAATAILIGVTLFVVNQHGLRNPCDTESQYYCIRIAEDNEDYGTTRTLILDHMVHSINHRDDPSLLITPYVHGLDELLRTHFRRTGIQSPSVFFAGGGAYTQPRAFAARYPEAHLEVAEIDPAVTQAAAQHLFVDMTNLKVFHQDARLRLPENPENSLDAVVTDVFHDVAVPWHLITKEFNALVRSRLKADGIYVMNIVDQFPDAKLVKSVIKTLREDFRHVQVWMEGAPEQATRLTYLISAGNGQSLGDRIVSEHGLPRAWFDFTEPVSQIGTSLEQLPLLTDDYAPVERLVAELFWTDLGT